MFNFRATLLHENIELFASNNVSCNKVASCMVGLSVLLIVVFLVSSHLECGLRNTSC